MRTFIAAAVLLQTVSPAWAQHTQIGAAAAVAGKVQAAGKVIASGAPIFQNDRIVTDAKGRMQILLLDETVFTVGPNSDMTLDEFVYDPNTSAGKVSAKVTKGVFRFVTGKVAKRDPATMKVTTPVGTIGIRGTIAGGQVDGDKTTVVLLGPGANNNTGDSPGGINVSNNSGNVDISRPNYGTTMGEGSGPTDPQPMPEFAASLSESLDNDSSGGSGSGSSTASNDSEESVSEEAGQETAAGGAVAVETEEGSESAEEGAEQSTFATQDEAQTDGLGQFTTWDQMRDLGGNPGGIWHYNGSNGYSCSGGTGSCLSGGSGTADFFLVVNFDTKVIGGSGSDITLSGSISQTNGIGVIPFSTMPDGDAKVTLSSVNTTLTGGNAGALDGTTIHFENSDGKAAADAIMNLVYTDSNNGDTSVIITGTGAPESGPPP